MPINERARFGRKKHFDRRFTLVRKTENGTFFPLVRHVLTKRGFFTIFHARKTSRFQRKKNEVEIFQLFPFPRAESR